MNTFADHCKFVIVTSEHNFSVTAFLNRIKSTLEDSEGNRSSCVKDKAHFGSMPLFTGSEFGDITVKNWTSITNEV